MANHVSSLKRVRQTERRTEFNRFAKSRLRNQIRAMRRALAGKELATKEKELNTAMSATFSLLDKAARKGYIKAGNAARYKSRLHLRVKAALGQTQQ